ncbi:MULTISPECIES: hypothetical protein [Pseudomonas]|nr:MULTISPECIES: hypothetical protein [Pseudomonas]MBP2271407.1 hypothetical protein [Pseudomonas sp. BP6]MBP2289622.1 hypothetical protein [Pseudomonas sp. BP7]
MRKSVLLDGMTHTEGARRYHGRFWFSDLYSFARKPTCQRA